jgi:hypothetical protein
MLAVEVDDQWDLYKSLWLNRKINAKSMHRPIQDMSLYTAYFRSTVTGMRTTRSMYTYTQKIIILKR